MNNQIQNNADSIIKHRMDIAETQIAILCRTLCKTSNEYQKLFESQTKMYYEILKIEILNYFYKLSPQEIQKIQTQNELVSFLKSKEHTLSLKEINEIQKSSNEKYLNSFVEVLSANLEKSQYNEYCKFINGLGFEV